jgi:hypothetical protein
VDGAEDDLGIVANGIMDDLVDLMNFAKGEVRAARNVDEDTRRARDRDVVEQRARYRLLRRFHRPVLAAPDAGTHQGRAARMHDGADIGEVDVHQPGDADQRGDALGRVEKHLVGLLQGILERNSLPYDGKQPLVRHDDHRVDVLAHLGDAQIGLAHALSSLEEKRLRHDADAERARLAGQFADHGRCARACATAHSACNEDQIGIRDRAKHLVATLLDRLAADLGPRACAQTACELLPDLDLHIGFGAEQRLGVGIHRDEFDSGEALLDHAIDRVATTATDAHDLHPGVR